MQKKTHRKSLLRNRHPIAACLQLVLMPHEIIVALFCKCYILVLTHIYLAVHYSTKVLIKPDIAKLISPTPFICLFHHYQNYIKGKNLWCCFQDFKYFDFSCNFFNGLPLKILLTSRSLMGQLGLVTKLYVGVNIVGCVSLCVCQWWVWPSQ